MLGHPINSSILRKKIHEGGQQTNSTFLLLKSTQVEFKGKLV